MGINFNITHRICFKCGAPIKGFNYGVYESENGTRVYLHAACIDLIAHEYCMKKLKGGKS